MCGRRNPRCMSSATIALPVAVSEPATAQLFEPGTSRSGAPAPAGPGRQPANWSGVGTGGGVTESPTTGASQTSPRGVRNASQRRRQRVVHRLPRELQPEPVVELQVERHRVGGQDRVLGPPRRGLLAEGEVLERPGTQGRQPGVGAGGVGVQRRPLAGRQRRHHGARAVPEPVGP